MEEEASFHRSSLLDTKVLAEWVEWVIDTSYTQLRYNLYMQAINLYWQMKFLMVRTILDHHESRMDTIHSLEHMYKDLNTLNRRMAQIERHLGILPAVGKTSANPTTPIPVTGSNSDPSTWGTMDLMYARIIVIYFVFGQWGLHIRSILLDFVTFKFQLALTSLWRVYFCLWSGFPCKVQHEFWRLLCNSKFV